MESEGATGPVSGMTPANVSATSSSAPSGAPTSDTAPPMCMAVVDGVAIPEAWLVDVQYTIFRSLLNCTTIDREAALLAPDERFCDPGYTDQGDVVVVELVSGGSDGSEGGDG